MPLIGVLPTKTALVTAYLVFDRKKGEGTYSINRDGRVRMEGLLLGAVQNRLQTRWIGQPEYTEAVRERKESEN